jgi:hypothetical protein
MRHDPKVYDGLLFEEMYERISNPSSWKNKSAS